MAATLMLYVGWRGSWLVFGVFALLLVVGRPFVGAFA
jgi:hypothetical protein